MKPRVLLLNSKVPFAYGGAELLVSRLSKELKNRGLEVDLLEIPWNYKTRTDILLNIIHWRTIFIEEVADRKVDVVIPTRFPSYIARHPNKVVWLIHQLRQAYDLKGTDYSDIGSLKEDKKLLEIIRTADYKALSEARELFAISRNVANRLEKFNNLKAKVLIPPPPLEGEYFNSPSKGYILSVGRLNKLKRFDLLIKAMAKVKTKVKCIIAGEGEEKENLLRLIDKYQLKDKVFLAGFVSQEELLKLYAESLAVFYAPFDEDLGFVAIEAFKSAKPVITTQDSGGVLEFVKEGINGFVVKSTPLSIAKAIDKVAEDEELAVVLGREGNKKVKNINWDNVISELLSSGLG